MKGSLQDVSKLGQSVWYDNIRRGLLTSGELERLIEMGITGLTSNPSIFEKAIAGSTDYDEALLVLSHSGKGTKEIFETLALEDIQAASDLLRPVYDRTGGADGYASLEVSPTLAHETEGTISEARRLFAALERPNMMVKVPATPEGIPAIRSLIGEGININVTLIFSLEAYRQVRDAYILGLEDLAGNRGDVGKVASVASFFVSRVDTAVDGLVNELIRGGRGGLDELLGKAAVSNAKLAYQAFKTGFYGDRFAGLRENGARVQRPLWASTGTKNPAYSDVLYVESLIGEDTVNTMPPATLTSFMEHGRAEATIEQGVDEAEGAIEALSAAGIDMEEVTDRLLADGVKAFADSFEKLLANIEDKKDRLLAQKRSYPGISLGRGVTKVEASIADLKKRDVAHRIWHKDHTVWSPDPTEITNRLGWLTVSDLMSDQVPDLVSFANEIRGAGYRHVVLLGMGGSSLGPEVLRQTIGSDSGYPDLIVLDSTVPATVHGVTETIDPTTTLFLVSSKSGGTIEPLSFYKHFRSLVEKGSGTTDAGKNFVAITDEGTSLAKMAQAEGFRRCFPNPSDIGGRYSVLSYFGMVPAALIGIDVARLLDRADRMSEGCASCVPVEENPGAWLGGAMGALTLNGQDKLTLITSPSIGSFGLWVEQLIAESTGKAGKGIIPVAEEPLSSSGNYGDDRAFVYMRLEGDDNQETDTWVKGIEQAGRPLIRLDLSDKYDIGAEFFRWEFATAVAGAVISIHPFDQPNVQQAKDLTGQVLERYQATGNLPQVNSSGSIDKLLADGASGDYLAVMAYVRQDPELDRAFTDLRRRVLERYHMATTLGYGPRFLHSTGQLHKGGGDNGIFLQLTTSHARDIDIPGESYTFGVLADAQALGDLQALQDLGRRVVRIHLEFADPQEITKLADTLS